MCIMARRKKKIHFHFWFGGHLYVLQMVKLRHYWVMRQRWHGQKKNRKKKQENKKQNHKNKNFNQTESGGKFHFFFSFW